MRELVGGTLVPARQRPRLSHGSAVRTVVRIARVAGDALAFLLGPVLALLCLKLLTGQVSPYVPTAHISGYSAVFVTLAVASLAWFWAWRGHYSYRKPMWSVLRDLTMAVAVCAVFELVLFALLKWQISRYAWALSWLFVLALLLLERFLIRRTLMRLGLWMKQCVIIGGGRNALAAYRALMHDPSMGFDIQYFVAGDPAQSPEVEGVAVLHDAAALWACTEPSDTQYVIALDHGRENLRDDWIRETTVRGCRAVSVIPDVHGIPLNSTDTSFVFSHDVLILHIRENLQKRSSRVLKRGFDIVASACLLVILSPVLAALWWKVRRDGGPALYGHMRVGRGGAEFPCLKFRSMVPNASQVLQQLLESDPQARAEWDANFKLKDDPRVTRLGRFLRRTSLDELPQLWNVLRGQMSLVGPRPIVDDELKFYGKQLDYYLLAKPGMTGIWQVSGRSDVDYDTRVYFDAWYVRNWSLWYDLVILFKTVGVVLQRGGAY